MSDAVCYKEGGETAAFKHQLIIYCIFFTKANDILIYKNEGCSLKTQT